MSAALYVIVWSTAFQLAWLVLTAVAVLAWQRDDTPEVDIFDSCW
ncbi:hypothetical protein [Mycobacterium sp. SMC-2]|nr:hypothetical protein [Mycobacterium sp. SMC-2]